MRAHLDLPTLQALQDEWRTNPPVHHLVASYLGYKPPAGAAPASPEQQQALQGLVSSMPVATSAPALDDSAWRAFNTPQEPAHG